MQKGSTNPYIRTICRPEISGRTTSKVSVLGIRLRYNVYILNIALIKRHLNTSTYSAQTLKSSSNWTSYYTPYSFPSSILWYNVYIYIYYYYTVGSRYYIRDRPTWLHI